MATVLPTTVSARKTTPRSALRLVARLLRSLRTPFGYALAFALPPLLVIALIAPAYAGVVAGKEQLQPLTLDDPLPAPPAYDPARRTALIVAGNTATESSDLLGPYEVLAASDAFNVYVVAPERRPTPLIPQPHCCGTLDILPHYSFAEYEQAIGVDPDLVVVPYIPKASTSDAAVLDWLRRRPTPETVVLSICGGAQMVADAGLLEGRRATSHHTILPILKKSHPEAHWLQGLRYVEDGQFISSAGVTSGVDATLYTLQRFLGRDAALEAARRVGYPHINYLDAPTWLLPGDNPAALLGDRLLVPNSFRWDRTDIGLILYPGVGEIELSSIIDTYPRSTSTDIRTIATDRGPVRTRHGLDLLPRFDLDSAPQLDRVLLPGQPDSTLASAVDQWAAQRGQDAERIHAGDEYAYDATFSDMARTETRLVARYAARWIEYPLTHLTLDGADWSPVLLLRMVAAGGFGVLLWDALRRRLRARRMA